MRSTLRAGSSINDPRGPWNGDGPFPVVSTASRSASIRIPWPTADRSINSIGEQLSRPGWLRGRCSGSPVPRGDYRPGGSAQVVPRGRVREQFNRVGLNAERSAIRQRDPETWARECKRQPPVTRASKGPRQLCQHGMMFDTTCDDRVMHCAKIVIFGRISAFIEVCLHLGAYRNIRNRRRVARHRKRRAGGGDQGRIYATDRGA